MALNKREDGCYICGRFPTEEHHIMFGTQFRSLSEKWDVKVYLCKDHHTGFLGAHHNQTLNRRLKELGQMDLDKRCGKNAFKKIFGRNYLDDEE